METKDLHIGDMVKHRGKTGKVESFGKEWVRICYGKDDETFCDRTEVEKVTND